MLTLVSFGRICLHLDWQAIMRNFKRLDVNILAEKKMRKERDCLARQEKM